VAGDALATVWPRDQEVVLLSYLLTAVEGNAISRLSDLADGALRPGGTLLIHDFLWTMIARGHRARHFGLSLSFSTEMPSRLRHGTSRSLSNQRLL